MTSFERHLAATRLGTVHVWHRPAHAGRPLLMLHMSPRSGRMYHEAMGRLDRPTIAVDRPGFGLSDPPPSPPTMDDYAAATLEVIDELGVDRFDVVGTHTGAVEAVAIATLAPTQVASVTLVAIPAYTDEEIAQRRLGVAAARPAAELDGSHLGNMWQRRISFRQPPLDLDLLRELLIDELRADPWVHWAYRAVIEYPMATQLAELSVPVTVLAPHDDLWLQTDRARRHLPPGSVFVELAHLDFDLWEKAPAEMAQLIDQHIPA